MVQCFDTQCRLLFLTELIWLYSSINVITLEALWSDSVLVRRGKGESLGNDECLN